MKYDELRTKIRKIIPTAQFDFDNDGQIIIYTELMRNPQNDLIPFESEYDDNAHDRPTSC